MGTHRLHLPLTLVTALVLAACGSSRPEVPFTRVTRGSIVSTVQTNGKIEPSTWAAIRSRAEGVVERIHVEKGQKIRRGDSVVTLDAGSAQSALAAAEARIAEAEAEIETLKRGGRGADLVAIEADLDTARLELAAAERDLAVLERLAEKEAATAVDVTKARDRVERERLRIESLERKRQALVSPADLRQAEARLSSARADAAAARRRIALAVVRSPVSGVLYQFDVRRGAYLRPGDLIGEAGEIDRVRAIIYVDEPELGRVGQGMPVTITWDALPEREWKGTIETVPTEVVALGTRQVGKVPGIIDNTDHELPPGANINAVIRSRVAENVLTIPKETLQRRGGKIGVFLLDGETVTWRPVQIGISSVTRAEVLTGLAEGDAIALPTEAALEDGAAVTPRFQD